MEEIDAGFAERRGVPKWFGVGQAGVGASAALAALSVFLWLAAAEGGLLGLVKLPALAALSVAAASLLVLASLAAGESLARALGFGLVGGCAATTLAFLVYAPSVPPMPLIANAALAAAGSFAVAWDERGRRGLPPAVAGLLPEIVRAVREELGLDDLRRRVETLERELEAVKGSGGEVESLRRALREVERRLEAVEGEVATVSEKVMPLVEVSEEEVRRGVREALGRLGAMRRGHDMRLFNVVLKSIKGDVERGDLLSARAKLSLLMEMLADSQLVWRMKVLRMAGMREDLSEDAAAW